MQVLQIKLAKEWPKANKKFGWVPEIVALPVEYNMLLIAQMANKHVQFSIDGRKDMFLISPETALEVVKLYRSVFTRVYDKKIIAVIPSSACNKL